MKRIAAASPGFVVWALVVGLGCSSSNGSSSSSNGSNSGSGSATNSGSGSSSASAGSGGSGGGACPNGQAPSKGTDGASDPLMNSWGAPCAKDSDCVALLGTGAVCLTQAVVYELPGGYCSKPCTLPDTMTTVVPDDPTCDPNGGVACVGQSPLFQYCDVICTDNQQCNRDGYYCRQMPQIAKMTDPSFCLMPDCCEGTCSGN